MRKLESILLNTLFLAIPIGLLLVGVGLAACLTLAKTRKAPVLPQVGFAGLNLPRPAAYQPPRVNEWQEYHQTREQTLRDSPQLAAEYQALLADIHKQEHDVDAAMIKADPTVAPILAKLALLRQRSAPHPSGSSAK